MNKITADDAILIERFQNGQMQAFDELVRRYQDQAYRYAFRLSKDSSEAADIVAEAFVRVYKSLERFKGDSSFSTWLYRIETNCFLDGRKKRANRKTASLDDGSVQHSALLCYEGESAHEILERGERVSAIEQGLSKISSSQRAILLMFHAESMTYEEIAAATNRPIGTVKSRINRARVSLQQALIPARRLFAIPAQSRFSN